MVPSAVPEELQGLTSCEEMLISKAVPIMNVYTKPGLGYLGYKGHVVTLPNKIQKVADIFPQCPKEIPVIVFTFKDKSNTSRDFHVLREKVLNALLWLKENNPLYQCVTIDYSRVDSLPFDGVLSLETVNFDEDIDQAMPDRAPMTSTEEGEILCKDAEISSFLPSSLPQPKEADRISETFNNSMEPHELELEDESFNEFNTAFLASLAFPCLFPDTKGDLTSRAMLRDISDSDTDSFSQKLKHLIKFAEYRNKKWFYRFSSHPRFAYWAYIILCRRRLIGQGNFYIKQNPSEALLSIHELRSMLQSGSYTLKS